MAIFKNSYAGVFLFLLLTHIVYGSEESLHRLISMDLESLSQIKVADSSLTFIDIDKKYAPSLVTTITQEDIKKSGARSLDELLEIYVPDLAYMYKVDGNQLGIGGIISDRNNKLLLTLNGKILNIRGTDGGAATERWLSMLGDIEEIQVISGPGSVIYGPGAIAGVINIKTFNADSFNGTEATLKFGYGENFGALEMKYGDEFSNGLGLFIYAGIDQYDGINKRDVINKFSFDYQKKDIYAYQNYKYTETNLNGSYEDKKRGKFYIQMIQDKFSFWSRYTQSGLSVPTYQNFYIFAKEPQQLQNTGTESEQWSNSITYQQKFGKLTLDYSGSFVLTQSEKRNHFSDTLGTKVESREQEEDITDFKILSTYKANQNTTYALGAEYAYNRFHNYKNDYIPTFKEAKSWNTGLFSTYGEMYHKQGDFRTLIDVRLDKHTYTDPLISYRLAEIYKIDPKHTFKMNFSHSIRHQDEVDMYRQVLDNTKKADTESIDRIETIYNYQTSHWNNYFRIAYNIHNIIAYDHTKKQTSNFAKAKFCTLEGKLEYSNTQYSIILSHFYTNLMNFQLKEPDIKLQNISASAYGYGSNFANWHNNITKVRFSYKQSEKLSFTGSLRVFWGIQGAVDMANYNMDTFPATSPNLPNTPNYKYYRLPVYKDSTKAFGANAYLNLSATYKIGKRTTLHLHGYNLLGLFEEDINKRNYFDTTSNYFDEAPALSVVLDYKFH